MGKVKPLSLRGLHPAPLWRAPCTPDRLLPEEGYSQGTNWPAREEPQASPEPRRKCCLPAGLSPPPPTSTENHRTTASLHVTAEESCHGDSMRHSAGNAATRRRPPPWASCTQNPNVTSRGCLSSSCQIFYYILRHMFQLNYSLRKIMRN